MAPVLVALSLYLLAFAALLLPWPFGTHPAWAYNWEGYTAWRWQTYWEPPAGPTFEIWAPNDGLMTDSGQGPLVGLPVAIGVALGGFAVDAMRLPVMLLAATSVPLLWLLGRGIIGSGAAALAALLLATSPAFLFYGRTATLVGISLVPLLLTALALARVLDSPPGAGWSWRREGALAAALLLGIFAYAPVRLVWPLTISLLILAAARTAATSRREMERRRHVLLMTVLLCLLIVPATVMVLANLTTPQSDPAAAAASYFYARGEQLVAMRTDPGVAAQYVREPNATTAGRETAWNLVTQNAADLAGLLLDRDTLPIPNEYWNERGRFWPWFFLPFAIVGAGAGLWRWWRQGTMVAVLPLVLAIGLTLPLLLTSRVHVGRLLPALPFALLLVAAGAAIVSSRLADLTRQIGIGAVARVIAPLVALAILVPTAAEAHVDLQTPIGRTREALTADALGAWQGEASERGGGVLVEDPALGDEIESVHAATYRLDLDDLYRFVDLRQEATAPATDARPPLFWRGALGALATGEIEQPCRRLWFVSPEIADDFLQTWRQAGCSGAPDSVVLP